MTPSPDITVEAAREAGLAVPSDRVPALVDELELELERSETVEEIALKYCRAFQFTAAASGRSPDGIAAAAVYVAGVLAEEEITQQAVADAAGVSVASVGNIYPALVQATENDDRIPIGEDAEGIWLSSLPEGGPGDRGCPHLAVLRERASLVSEPVAADREEGSEP